MNITSSSVLEGTSPVFAEPKSQQRKLRILGIPANSGGIRLRLLPMFTAFANSPRGIP
jgi:hypothetical protein